MKRRRGSQSPISMEMYPSYYENFKDNDAIYEVEGVNI